MTKMLGQVYYKYNASGSILCVAMSLTGLSIDRTKEHTFPTRSIYEVLNEKLGPANSEWELYSVTTDKFGNYVYHIKR